MFKTTKLLRFFVFVCILMGTFTFAPAPSLHAKAVSPDIVISQIYGGGGNSGATYRNDYIELFNRGTVAVNVTGWSVQYASYNGTTWQKTDLFGTIQPGQYYLVQEAAGTGGTTDLPTPDATGSIAMNATNGKVALVSSTTLLSGACPTGVVDFVGYGTANCYEGTATPALSNTTAAKRNSNGCTDTDANNADFTVADPTLTPTPRNTASPFNPCSTPLPNLTVDDISVMEGNSGTVTASFTVSLSAPAGAGGVTFDIATADNTATTADNDYVARSLTGQAIPAGSSSYTFDVTVNGDTAIEPNENFHVNVANVTGATVTDGQGLGTINNDDNLTPIYAIQGNGSASPMLGATVTTEGIVVSDDEGPSPALRGFYLQDAAGDGDPATSDGIFIYNGNSNSVSLGDKVLVTGTVSEYFDQTQVSAASITVISSGNTLTPTEITLPFPSADYPERYEGMLVRFAQTLYVTEHYLLGRFGQVTLSSGGRLDQPTSVALPGAPALAVQAANDLNRIILDDSLQSQNPDPIPFGRGGLPLSASNTLRAGDTVTDLVGVLTYTWGGHADSPNAYRIRPLEALDGGAPDFVPANARPVTPLDVGGEIKVASMNLLNYFNTFGAGNCTTGVGGAATDCRGADDAEEFTRQSTKIVNAIVALDADVIGIVEIENDGYGAASAIQDLVNKLNAATSPGAYAFINADALTGKTNALGADAIKVGLLYKPATVSPVGVTAVLDTTAFVNGGDSSARNRVSLLQAFQTGDGARFLVNVNHLKSKGSACDDPDAGDGQGNCNIVRLNAVNELLAWFASDPTGTGDPDLLLLGDLNSYALEDPIAALESGDFVNLVPHFGGPGAYSYAYDGQWGTLDYLFASPSLLSQATGAGEWHINADEPSVLDYNTDYKSPGQIISLYSPDPFRTGDHDPLLAGLTLESAAPTVDINQAASQPDPATAAPILFEVLFSKPVIGFTAEDVVVTGTAPGVKTVLVSGTGAAYTVSVSGMSGPGTVVAAIPSGAAQDLAGNPSLASLSADNTVTFGHYPTDITLNAASIPENQPAGSLVALLTASDPDPGESHTFSLVANPSACPLALDNASFQVPLGTNELRTAAVFDYEAQSVYTVCLRAADPLGLAYDEQVTLLIVDVNEPPALDLANPIHSLPENTDTSSPIKVADILLTDDALGVNVLTLSDADAALFEISGPALYLKAGAVLDFETNPVLDVTVSVDDASVGLSPDDSVSLSISVTSSDTTAPSVLSVTRLDVNPSALASVRFTVTFSELVIGLDLSDFSLAVTGLSGVTVTGVSGSGAAYTVTVSTGSGVGTLRLDLSTGASVADLAGNPLSGLPYTAGQVYSIRIQSFADVPITHSAWQWIERLYAAGITGGCGGGNFCPNSPATRAQMAVFLLRGIHGSTYVPPDVGGSTGFNDVPTTHQFAAWIKQLAAEGITAGCGNGNYCPSSPVTRAQMAVFLLRSEYGSGYTPPPVGDSTGFNDVPITHQFAAWIKQLAAEGITAGCGDGNYCPDNPVTRAQMAIFLVKTFDLP